MARHVFLTGSPGVGKTTLIQKASELLQSSGLPVDGFYTEEVRQGGRRTGFDVVTLSGARGPLSRVGSEPQPGKRDCRVGQYVVDLTSFEQLALPVLKNVEKLRHGGGRTFLGTQSLRETEEEQELKAGPGSRCSSLAAFAEDLATLTGCLPGVTWQDEALLSRCWLWCDSVDQMPLVTTPT
ncbi:cancer-related nucleoside-triphosphatase isoform X4 [Heterocephalus glaber]|uniref:Cancer-related nucleoside-triphosphatase isoform X4 n=1 Tax=Heterocephalus glaber TaxID=10181 RepID=A0AAX6TI27_HETGA|nr:cancer-related nucleoside-triphosphatase isoform X4 [Heterocephalus glaber]